MAKLVLSQLKWQILYYGQLKSIQSGGQLYQIRKFQARETLKAAASIIEDRMVQLRSGDGFNSSRSKISPYVLANIKIL